MLINSKKFDVRLYVVIKGFDKIEAYICDEGIARLCTVSHPFTFTFLFV
jgi:hypothetical protein